jgi:L-asparaginase
VDGIVIAGVGNGNFAPSFMTAIAKANKKKIPVVRATRVISGGVSSGLEDVFPGQIAPGCLLPQKARILLMLALTQTDDPERIGKIFLEY